MRCVIEVDSTSLPEETEITKIIASELIRLGVSKVSFLTVTDNETIDQSALSDVDPARVVSPTIIRQLPQ